MKKTYQTEKAPAAVGPYSQAVSSGNMLFVSGQIPLDPETGTLVDGDISVQTERVLENVKAILDAAGSSLNQVLKASIFLTDMNDFAAVNAVYARYFSEPWPARACVAVSALPKGVAVEMEVIASL